MKYSAHNVFEGVPVRDGQASLFEQFTQANDFSVLTVEALVYDLRKLARWFVAANHEPFEVGRLTTRDLSDFREYLRRELNQSVATCNRALVSVRRFCHWLTESGHLPTNPAKRVKELRRQPLAPKGLDRPQVRRLLRELELRNDLRGSAIIGLMLFTGARVSDVVGVEICDLGLSERSGTVTFRFGKHHKERSVPLNLSARRALEAYLQTRPPINSARLFIGERGPLTATGVRALCRKYGCICGFKLYPHLLRHTAAKELLAANNNDLVATAQILGHESVNTTARYTQRTQGQLAEVAERVTY